MKITSTNSKAGVQSGTDSFGFDDCVFSPLASKKSKNFLVSIVAEATIRRKSSRRFWICIHQEPIKADENNLVT
jgi:hypothetical protein